MIVGIASAAAAPCLAKRLPGMAADPEVLVLHHVQKPATRFLPGSVEAAQGFGRPSANNGLWIFQSSTRAETAALGGGLR